MITFFYNEEKDILDYLNTVTEKFGIAAQQHSFDFEIVMVDDGSTDQSKAIVQNFIHTHSEFKIRLHSYPVNKGIGHALVEGLTNCQYDYIFWNDVDMHFDILDIDKILPRLRQDTIVVVHKNNIKYKEFGPWLVSRTNYYMLKTLFFWKIKDFQFVQFYPADYLKNVPIISRSSLIPCELLTRSRRYGYQIRQIPLLYYSPGNDRQSKCMNVKNIYFTLRDMLRLRISLLGQSLKCAPSTSSILMGTVAEENQTSGPEDRVLG